MAMAPGPRKVALTTHVLASLGWFGAVAGFLALAITGLNSQDAQMVRAVYLAMEPLTWFVIVPLSFASLLTGLVSSLGTTWGLFRHHWVLLKFLLTAFATVVLLVHTQPIDYIADVAADGTLSSGDLPARIQLVIASAAALVVFLAATTLAVFKPRGMTRYGRRKQHVQRTGPSANRNRDQGDAAHLHRDTARGPE